VGNIHPTGLQEKFINGGTTSVSSVPEQVHTKVDHSMPANRITR
jgi:hypothetical protein